MRIRVIFRSFQHRAAHLSLEVYFATSFFQFKLTPEDQKIRGIKFSHWWWSMKQPMSKFQRQRVTQIHGINTVTMISGARIMMAGKTGASQLPSSSDGALFCDCGSLICTSLPLDYESLSLRSDCWQLNLNHTDFSPNCIRIRRKHRHQPLWNLASTAVLFSMEVNIIAVNLHVIVASGQRACSSESSVTINALLLLIAFLILSHLFCECFSLEWHRRWVHQPWW